MAEELKKAKGCLKAQKGHFTRNRASVETRLKAVMDEPDNDQAWSVLQKAYERYEKSWEKLDEAFTMVLLVEPDEAEQGHVTLEQADYFHQFEQATTELTRAANIRKAEQQRGAEGRRADGGVS